MRTYRFAYEGKDDFCGIDFCAETPQEAVGLFENWCDENGYDTDFLELREYFNYMDALEYGVAYKTDPYADLLVESI